MKKSVKIGLNVMLGLVLVLGSWHLWSRSQMTPADTWPRIQRERKVVVGVDDTYIPMGFRNAQGQLVGYDVDLARATFRRMGIEPQFQVIDWSMKELELETKHIDVIWNGYTMNPERAKRVAFSKPYYNNRQVLLVKKDQGVTKLADMAGKRLGLQAGSAGLTDFNHYPQVLKQKIQGGPVLYDTYDKALNDVQVGRLDAVLIDSDYATYFQKNSPHGTAFKLVETTYPASQYAVGLRQSDPQLKRALDRALAEVAQDGTQAKIQAQYFGK